MKIMMKYVPKFFIVCFSFLICTVCLAKDYSYSDIPNPNVADRRVYVADPGNLLSLDVKNSVNNKLDELRKETSAEVGVAVVPSIGDVPIEEFSEKLFTSWGLGKKDKDNGILLVIAIDQRAARIETGYGTEGIMPDITAKKIIEKDIVPNMKNGDLNAAVSSSVGSIVNLLSDPEYRQELESSAKEPWEQSEESDITKEDFLIFCIVIAVSVFLVSLGYFIYDSVRLRKAGYIENAREWHKRRSMYLGLSFLSLGLGFLIFLLSERKRKKSRNNPLICECCGAKMKKLNEEEDNMLLSPSQDLEERLNTVDYDVWVCPECGSVERFPFKENQIKYTECPRCHTVAYGLVEDHTLVPATTRRPGTGEKIYECKYCHYRKNEKYTIPRKENMAGVLGAAAILGSGMDRGSGGGGGFGGGFGGGRTGGGGASGRW